MSNRPTPRQAEIYGCFDGLADIHEDKNTEFLLALTADVMKCSQDEVCAALQVCSLEQRRSNND